MKGKTVIILLPVAMAFMTDVVGLCGLRFRVRERVVPLDSPLIEAIIAGAGEAEITRIIEKDPAGVNKVSLGFTPLGVAITERRTDVVKILLANGADANFRDPGWSHLHGAALLGERDIALMLMRAGAKLTARDLYGRTPADVAEEAGHPDLAKLLRNPLRPATTGSEE